MESAAVISLDRRPERAERFYAGLPSYFPLPFPSKTSATDGSCAYVPTNWLAGPGAYGCLLSHLRLWQESRKADGTLWVFEDDCVFCPEFTGQYKAFMANVPDDWEMVYLGGQHILPHEKVAEGVERCMGVKKTHAYAVRGRPLRMMLPILERSNTHIDVTLSLHHSSMKVYAPSLWLCGQAAGESDILAGSDGVEERWWQPERNQ